MKMMNLDGPNFLELKNGYRDRYDLRPLVKRFSEGDNTESCWEEVWNELHHQGDVDTASFAFLPFAVEIYRNRSRGFDIYLYAATLQYGAGRGTNPVVPDWMSIEYGKALESLFEMAVLDLRSGLQPIMVRPVLAYLASYSGAPHVGDALMNMDTWDDYSEVLTEFEQGS
jgi:hypothetical protein